MASNVFEKIDNSIDQSVKDLRSSNFFQKMSETIRSFTESEQLVINQVLSASVFIIPLVFISVFAYLRFSTASELELRKEIENQILAIKESQSEFSAKSRSVLSSTSVTSKRELVSGIDQVKRRFNIKASAVSVDNFQEDTEGGSVQRIEANIKFKSLTSVAFSELLLGISEKFKATVSKINVSKDTKSRLLYGNFYIVFLTKAK